MSKKKKRVGFDLDGTLAYDLGEPEFDYTKVGPPIMSRVELAKRYIAEDRFEVCIFTARASLKDYETIFDGTPEEFLAAVKKPIEEFCLKYLGKVVPIICEKDYLMDHFYDDRAYRMEKNVDETKESVSSLLGTALRALSSIEKRELLPQFRDDLEEALISTHEAAAEYDHISFPGYIRARTGCDRKNAQIVMKIIEGKYGRLDWDVIEDYLNEEPDLA